MAGQTSKSTTAEDFLLEDGRETIGTTPLDAVPDGILCMPGDPLLLS